MSRIGPFFLDAKRRGRKALVGYLTAGDPDPRRSEADVLTAVATGIDVLELGVPFSDPTADGPEIQAAARRAIEGGMTLGRCLGLVRSIRKKFDGPVVLFGYTNPFYRYGYKALCRDAAKAGVDGILAVDMPHEESAELTIHMRRHGLDFIPLVAPTTPLVRARALLAGARGFVYYVMFKGVTGARSGLPRETVARIRAVKRVTRLPVVGGFGISGGRQARAVARHADGVVVGSALVRAAREGRLRALVRELRSAVDGCS